jgi:hypothetical protein
MSAHVKYQSGGDDRDRHPADEAALPDLRRDAFIGKFLHIFFSFSVERDSIEGL